MMRLTLGLSVSLVGFSLTGWATLVIPPHRNADVLCADDTLLAEDVLSDSNSGCLSKTGSGELTVPVEQVKSSASARIMVRNGSVRLTKGTNTGSCVEPVAVLDKAAFWLKADTNVVFAEGSGFNVEKWYDARETSAAIASGLTLYPSAVAVKTYENDIIYPCLATDEESGLKVVNFNGVHSASAMKYTVAGAMTQTTITGVKHLFIAHRMRTGVGFFWGMNSGDLYFQLGNYKGDFDKYMNANDKVYGKYAVTRGRYWRDGIRFDPFTTTASAGAEVMEFAAAPSYDVEVGNFFCERSRTGSSYGYRCGGDDVGESIVFTNSLTESERMAISAYLVRKWRGNAGGGISEICTATNGVVSVTGAADDFDMSGVALRGAGTLVKSGTGSATFNRLYGTEHENIMRVDEGTLSSETGEATLDLVSGRAVSVVRNDWDVQTFSTDALSDNSAAEITGAISVRAAGISQDISSLKFAGPDLVMGYAPAARTPVSGDAVWATIADPSFEEGGKWTVQDKGAKSSSERVSYASQNGWRTTYWNASAPNHGAPDGTYVFLLRWQPIFAHAPIHFPVAGVYDFSFFAAPRSDCDNYPSAMDILLFREGETNVVGRLKVRHGDGGYTRYTFRLPKVEAGDYRIGFRNQQTEDVEVNVFLDDLKAKLVADADLSEVTIPSGDFERETYPLRTSPTIYALDTAFGVTGWTLKNDGLGAISSVRPDVAVVCRKTTDAYASELSSTGDRQLCFTGTSGLATSDAFPVAPGRYTIRFDAQRLQRDSFTCNGNKYKPWDGPAFKINVYTNGADECVASFETGTLTSFEPFHFMGDNKFFTIEAVCMLVVEISQVNVSGAVENGYTWLACGAVDNVRLAPEGTGNSAELIANGSFKNSISGENWIAADNKDGLNANAEALRVDLTVSQNYYGYAICDDTLALRICQCGSIEQTVDVPADGWYRLSFWTRARADSKNDPVHLTHQYGGNQLRVWWTSDAVTNRILQTGCIFSTNFLEHTALVKLPMGKVTLGFAGVNRKGVEIVSPSETGATLFLDCISLKACSAPQAPVLDDKLELKIEGDARLRLEYDGMVNVGRVRLGSRWHYGEISAETCPGQVTGPGKLFGTSSPTGLILIVK